MADLGVSTPSTRPALRSDLSIEGTSWQPVQTPLPSSGLKMVEVLGGRPFMGGSGRVVPSAVILSYQLSSTNGPERPPRTGASAAKRRPARAISMLRADRRPPNAPYGDSSDSISKWTISLTKRIKSVSGHHWSMRRAFEASPTSKSTSAGRKTVWSCFT